MIASQYFAGGMSVGNIPGISFAYEQRLNNVGIYNANQLFVQYHLLQQNYAAFTGWLVNTCGATTPTLLLLMPTCVSMPSKLNTANTSSEDFLN